MININATGWKSIEALALVTSVVDIMLEETKSQYLLFFKIKSIKEVFDDELIMRLYNHYSSQLDQLLFLQDQVKRWKESDLEMSMLEKVEKLGRRVTKVITLTTLILEHTRSENNKSNHTKIIRIDDDVIDLIFDLERKKDV